MTKLNNNNTERQNIFTRSRIIAAIIVMLLVIAVTIISLTSLHSQTEEECWQNLRLAARTADDQLGVLMNNTFANLNNMGNLLTDLGAIDGDNVVEEVGRSRIGSMQMETRLYLPDGRAFTSGGIFDDVSDSINYTEIMNSLNAEGRYISCVKKDFADSEKIVMEYFVPVMKDGRTAALLSAVMDTNKLQDRITSNAYNGGTRVYGLDTRDGMVFLDNDHKQVYPITVMSDRVDKNGKSIRPYLNAIMDRQETFTTVESERHGVPGLMFSIPSEVNENWEIIIVTLESTAFAAETNVRNAIAILAATEIGLFVIFLIWLLLSVKREKSEIIKKGEEKQKVLADNLEESLTFTNYFLSTYLAAYYADLNDCSCQVYKRTENLDRDYPVIDDYYESLKQYINHAVHPDDRKELTGILSPDSLRKILEKAPEYSYIYRDISGGSEKNIRLQVIRGADENHAAFGFADVTHEFEEQQKRMLAAEERKALAENNARMLALEDNIVSLYDLDLDTGEYEMYVKNGANDHGIITQVVKSSNFYEDTVNNLSTVAYPEDRDGIIEVLKAEYIRGTLEKESHFDYYYRLLAGDTPVWAKMRIVYKNADKQRVIIGAFNAEKEVEARQLQEAFNTANEANESNKLVLSFINGVKWSYFINDNDEIIDAKYGDSVANFFNFDYSKKSFDWIDIVYPDDKDGVTRALSEAVHDRDGNKTVDFTYRIMGTDGTYHWVKDSGKMFRHENGIRELTGITVDVTEQMEKEREQQRQLAEALSMAESANRAKTTFLNNMSHDIRTPMNAIIGYTGLAASHINNKEQVQDYLSKIAQSSDHLLSLINDVLDMSRIESGKMNLDEKPENLSDIIHTLRDIIQADIHSKQLDFYVDAVDVNDEDVICDKLRLNQVLLNVLSNAIKYTAAGGTVTMRVSEKTVKQSGYGSYEFTIKDNGMGMDEEFVKTIFDPFTRVKSSTVSGIQGTGLGMAITKNIIDMMGGRIDITSTPGKGTEVVMDFDFKLQSTPKTPEEIPELKGVRALVADDDSNTCLSISKMVKEIGMSAEWCTSGKEAVIRAGAAYREGDSFKVFIIDWIMPDMNGIETARRIRKVIGDDTPIIILTAYDWSDIEEEAREAGVTAFVSKPMFPSDLHRVLNKCLGKIEEPAEENAVEYDFTGKKILLVEDNELNREIATEILIEDGFIIDTAEDGDIAVEKMKAAKVGEYDLVLMDVQMPHMNGYEATKAIRALGTEISRIPILAMTANAFEEDRKLAIEAGMNEHIAKPIDIDKLKETMKKFL